MFPESVSNSYSDSSDALNTDAISTLAKIVDDGEYLDVLPDWEDDLDEIEDDELDWDDPEPLAEYDSELQQPLYVIEDDGDGFGVELRIDQWVAEVDSANATQRRLIAELLKGLGYNRLRQWLPWLDNQHWTGESLLLFLRFRVHWESSPHWWEHSYWDWRTRCWYPVRRRDSLSRDDTYELVQLRLDYPPHKVIDETWLADWLDLALWQHGFRSFASFAVFRARFAPGDDWQRHIEWYAPVNWDDDEVEHRWNHGHHIYRCGPPVWFAEQNWYEPVEWHDSLGW